MNKELKTYIDARVLRGMVEILVIFYNERTGEEMKSNYFLEFMLKTKINNPIYAYRALIKKHGK